MGLPRLYRNAGAAMSAAEALLGFFTSDVDIDPPAGFPVGEVWWEERDGWLLPWRVTSLSTGYPCGEPVKVVQS